MNDTMFEGRWRSPTGAEIHLFQCGDAISGTYTAEATETAVPCRGRVLIGTADAGIIGLVTSCRAPHMITSWTGRLVQTEGSGTPEIHTVCHAVDRLSQDLDTARSVSLQTIVFTKLSGRSWRSPPHCATLGARSGNILDGGADIPAPPDA